VSWTEFQAHQSDFLESDEEQQELTAYLDKELKLNGSRV